MTLFALLTKKLENALDKAPIVTRTVMYLSMKTTMKRLTKNEKEEDWVEFIQDKYERS